MRIERGVLAAERLPESRGEDKEGDRLVCWWERAVTSIAVATPE